MDDTTIARTIHVLAVVLWIGGVGFVTTVLLPAVRRMKSPADRLNFFDDIERHFAWQARITTLLAGLAEHQLPALAPSAWSQLPKKRSGDFRNRGKTRGGQGGLARARTNWGSGE
jgi:hypothetical protein